MSDGNSKNGKTVIYTRVSSLNQKDDLNNQIEFLKQLLLLIKIGLLGLVTTGLKDF